MAGQGHKRICARRDQSTLVQQEEQLSTWLAELREESSRGEQVLKGFA